MIVQNPRDLKSFAKENPMDYKLILEAVAGITWNARGGSPFSLTSVPRDKYSMLTGELAQHHQALNVITRRVLTSARTLKWGFTKIDLWSLRVEITSTVITDEKRRWVVELVNCLMEKLALTSEFTLVLILMLTLATRRRTVITKMIISIADLTSYAVHIGNILSSVRMDKLLTEANAWQSGTLNFVRGSQIALRSLTVIIRTWSRDAWNTFIASKATKFRYEKILNV